MNLTSPRVIKDIQQKFGFTFKKGLGQNFLTSQDILDDIVDALGDESAVLEIGPGFGTLTAALAERMDKVVSIEIDERLLDVLDYTLEEFNNIKIINGDALKLDLHALIREEFGDRKISVAANLPYYITTPVITTLLENKLPLNSIVVMVQKEVAERLTALPGSKDYGAITVMCRYFSEPSIVTKVPSSLFLPPPKVDSAVLKLRLRETPAVDVRDEKMFFRVVKAAFSQRRKTLLNCMCANFPFTKDDMASILSKNGIEPSRRGETLSLEEFALIADSMNKMKDFAKEQSPPV